MSTEFFSSTQGMATITPTGVAVFNSLEDLFLIWATRCNAQEVRYPSLIRVQDLDRLNYFQNFPQLVMCACTLHGGVHDRYSQGHDGNAVEAIPSADLRDPEYCLPPAACYSIYLDLQGSTLNRTQYFTTTANCFRSESHFRGLERLRGFSMREIVCVGTAEDVKTHLGDYRELLGIFMDNLGLPVAFEHATDPFFDKSSAAARAERIFPTKEELVYDGNLAIGSINYHRRFFGKRCDISIDGRPASTGCVAFGIERWMHALAQQFGNDPQRIAAAINVARIETLAQMTEQRRMQAVGT
ncbi:aminoacyl--tRNA ligase-related protein [Pelagibius sp.]|uniref:aminoacyl--tRNA ligase-related protein n=1 Tax=Pelagibius sp. TaxID=1931238 RepID=UPI003B4FFDFA